MESNSDHCQNDFRVFSMFDLKILLIRIDMNN